MGAKLTAILELQNIQLQIVDIQSQVARHTRRVAAQQKKLNAAGAQLESERQQVTRDQIKFDELDNEIKARVESVEKLRQHLNSVRTNKEYAAVLAQMNNEKADATKVEGQAMELMQSLETRRAAIAEAAAVEKKLQEKLRELESAAEQARQTFAGRLNDLDGQRVAAAAQIEPNVCELFDRLAERYEGEVLAEVIRTNPRRDEFVCGGCHIALRPDVPNTLKIRDEVITCKTCGRIMYLADKA